MTETYLTNVRFLDGGYCSQFARLAGESSWKPIHFHAVFVYFEHPVHGPSLIDSAYSRHFLTATGRFPERLYRWITPVRLNGKEDTAQVTTSYGLNPSAIRRIFISHFHADHIGGLKCFATPELIYREEAFRRIQKESRVNQVRHGFLSALIPDDFEERGVGLAERKFSAGNGLLQPFQVCDYWNDGSLILVDLPGHADGHFGFLLKTSSQTLFYIVDACWHLDVLFSNKALPWISQKFQFNNSEYQATQDRLRRLRQETDWKFVACHCPRTIELMQNANN